MSDERRDSRRSDIDAASAIEGGGRDGWVSNLLRRASTDEDRTSEAPVPASNEALDSLSLDLLRLVDPEMSSDVYRRYRTGERDAFTRALAENGDDALRRRIADRFRADNETRSVVERYIEQFEREVNALARTNRVAAQDRLRTLQGRAYSLLLAATGRR